MEWSLPYLDEQYKKYVNNIAEWLPEGMIDVNLDLLHGFNLLHYHSIDREYRPLTRYFQVSQTEEKITLTNEQFVVWIVPDKAGNAPATYTLIALKGLNQLQLEVGFSTSGIYNSSHLVLRVLEKFLLEIQETEALMSSLKQKL